VDQVVPVRADEALAPVVEREPELAEAADRLAPVVGEVEPEVHAADVDGLVVGPPAPLDFAAALAVRDGDPVVDPEGRMADAELWIPGGEALEERLADVGLAVAVGILQIEDVRRRGDDDAALPWSDAVGHEESVGEDRARFVEAVAILVLEEF